MTTRELLRVVADYLDEQMNVGKSHRAAALRQLATRLDEEIDRATALGSWGTGTQGALARLDATLEKK